ncbi:MAG TPA: hypothetical protein VFV81_00110, partial [Verrucomicrobiae bacterium]|nr:hypothetical protein [Verrucomicrobiae bacterium]
DYGVRSGVTNETVTFTGHARASTPQMDLTGEPLIWDRARNAFHAEHETILIKQSLNLMPTNAAPSAVTNQVPKPE